MYTWFNHIFIFENQGIWKIIRLIKFVIILPRLISADQVSCYRGHWWLLSLYSYHTRHVLRKAGYSYDVFPAEWRAFGGTQGSLPYTGLGIMCIKKAVLCLLLFDILIMILSYQSSIWCLSGSLSVISTWIYDIIANEQWEQHCMPFISASSTNKSRELNHRYSTR